MSCSVIGNPPDDSTYGVPEHPRCTANVNSSPVIYEVQGAHPGEDNPCRYYRDYIIQQHQCCHKHTHGDGIFNTITKQWQEYRCELKSCPRHWQRYSIAKYRQFTKHLVYRTHWHNIRLSSPVRFKDMNRQTAIELWANDIIKAYPDAAILVFLHSGPTTDHYHAVLGSDHKPDRKVIRDAWKAHHPGKAHHPWHFTRYSIKEHTNPLKPIHYGLFRSAAKHLPPWYALTVRKPYKFFGTVKT